MRVLALDQGTTSTRLLLADGAGLRVLGQLRHAVRHPAPGHVEQDAAEILANCRSLLDAAGPADALGLANQGESCLAWDALTGVPLSQVIVWQDRRTRADLERIAAEGLADEVRARAGLPLDPYFSAAKLAWLLREIPAVAEARRKGRLRLGTTDAFLLQRLTGHCATDRATASRTSLMNLSTGAWDADLCRIFGVPMSCLPEIRNNVAGFGHVNGVPVTAAIVDQQAALYGHGCRNAGEAKITFGTGAFALVVTGTTRPDNPGNLLPTIAWDLGAGMTYALDGGVQDAGSAVEWALRAGIAREIADFDDFPNAPAIDRGLVFVPAFSGLGAPHWDRSAAPLIIGLTPEMFRRDLCQALLEGIAFQTAALLDEMAQAQPLATPVAVDGGLSASDYFIRFLAQVSQRSITISGFAEQTAFGTAALAALALGVQLTVPSTSCPPIVPTQHRPDWTARFALGLGRSQGWLC